MVHFLISSIHFYKRDMPTRLDVIEVLQGEGLEGYPFRRRCRAWRFTELDL